MESRQDPEEVQMMAPIPTAIKLLLPFIIKIPFYQILTFIFKDIKYFKTFPKHFTNSLENIKSNPIAKNTAQLREDCQITIHIML